MAFAWPPSDERMGSLPSTAQGATTSGIVAPSMDFQVEAREVAQRLRAARRAAALSGAGMSVESGLPTFRSGSRALWRNHDPMMLATPEAFAHDPALVWEWYRERMRSHA